MTPSQQRILSGNVIITSPDSLIKWAQSKGIATDMGNVYLGSLFMKQVEKERRYRNINHR